MPKLNKPTHGTYVYDYLLQHEKREELRDDYDDLANVVFSIRIALNTGVCMNANQADYLEGIDWGADAVLDKTANKELPIINGFRLECYDCLNPDCKHRDPDFPVEAVQERAKQFEESEETDK